MSALWAELAAHHAHFDASFSLVSRPEQEIRRLLDAVLRDPDSAVFLWEEADRVPGLCAVHVDRGPPILAEASRAEITDLIVAASERRRGIGRALVDHALRWLTARGIERCEVRVASGNEIGQAFWRALGFGDLMDVLHRRL